MVGCTRSTTTSRRTTDDNSTDHNTNSDTSVDRSCSTVRSMDGSTNKRTTNKGSCNRVNSTNSYYGMASIVGWCNTVDHTSSRRASSNLDNIDKMRDDIRARTDCSTSKYLTNSAMKYCVERCTAKASWCGRCHMCNRWTSRMARPSSIEYVSFRPFLQKIVSIRPKI